jgi:tetratricopeptide (TPR) repeat protein
MTLRASLLREVLNPTVSVGRRIELCCELAQDFENKGEYEEARELLSGLWPEVDQRPDVADLEQDTAAEVLLRAGVLTGWIGSHHQITDPQEKAKNLISESLTIFEARKYPRKIAEAQTELAWCYWRTGEYNEALDCLKLALAQLPNDNDLRAKTVLRMAVVEHFDGRSREALAILTDNAALFEKIHNDTLKGCYRQTLADALVKLWDAGGPRDYLDQSLLEYAAASYHFEQAEHRNYLANAENNLGFLLYKVNHCEQAHHHLDSARRIFARLKDKESAAQVDETRARVFLKENREAEAEKLARGSVRVLEHSERHALLAESLTTHATALARLGQYGAALVTFRRALDLSQRIGSHARAAEVALAVFQEMGDRLAVAEEPLTITGRKLSEEVRDLEQKLIKRALEATNGSITYAARYLGMSYQALTYMLETRHKDLISDRIPVRPRQRKQ